MCHYALLGRTVDYQQTETVSLYKFMYFLSLELHEDSIITNLLILHNAQLLYCIVLLCQIASNITKQAFVGRVVEDCKSNSLPTPKISGNSFFALMKQVVRSAHKTQGTDAEK